MLKPFAFLVPGQATLFQLGVSPFPPRILMTDSVLSRPWTVFIGRIASEIPTILRTDSFTAGIFRQVICILIRRAAADFLAWRVVGPPHFTVLFSLAVPAGPETTSMTWVIPSPWCAAVWYAPTRCSKRAICYWVRSFRSGDLSFLFRAPTSARGLTILVPGWGPYSGWCSLSLIRGVLSY